MMERKNKLSKWLMIFSMLLLMVLQGLWLRAEYRSAVDSFNRETNLLFRNTVHQLSDSLFFSMFRMSWNPERQNGIIDSTGTAGMMMARLSGNNGALEKGEKENQQEHQTMPEEATIVIHRSSDQETRNDLPGGAHGAGQQDMRYIFRHMAEVFNEDSLIYHFGNVLADRYEGLSFTILRKEIDRSSRFSRFRPEPTDSIPFTTSFVPLGWSFYAASFDHVGPLIFQRLLPQIGFSVFITLVIFLSFMMVYRSLRAQERLLEQKNDFIGNMTHELKTPVATVGVALEAMKNFNVLKNTDKAHLYLDMAMQELQRLSMMTDKIIQSTIFDYGSDIRLNKEYLDMRPVVDKVLSSFSLVAEKAGTKVIFTADGDTGLMGHNQHLTQMVYNLIDNAFKYAGEGPEIRINLSADTDQVVLTVSDKGPGIAEAHLSRVFDKFYRVPTGNIHDVKGYGMGLHYVKGVVNSHGGRISLESKAGEGAVFTIRLPKQNA